MIDKLHLLKEYTALLDENGLIAETNLREEILDKKVNYVSFNSQDIRYDTLFICKGAHFTVDYLLSALDEGAFAYISEVKYEKEAPEAPYIIVTDMRKTMALVADLFYNQVWKRLTITGITGTKGKSTTTYFMRYILDEYLRDQKKPVSAVISGIDNYDGIINEESHLTTPEALDLHRHYNNAVKSGIEFLTMEVSSQALKYHRTRGITFDVGCFLNIGIDHISAVEHPDFEDYLKAKMVLMGQCKTVCVNLESDYAKTALSAAEGKAERVITFGLKEGADICGYDVRPEKRGISFRVKCDSFDEEFRIGMTGLFNVENALAAISISYGLNIPLEHIKAGLKKARVSGRMEIYTSKSGKLDVIVDYAHNQMSFESLFHSTKKEYPGKKITIVFGCPGKKALGRRKELGDIAGKYADKVYITEEDAGEEPVMKISEEIAGHVKEFDCECHIIVDRKEAIRQAIETADDNTIVLITGKGRETRQKRGTQYIDTPSDVDYVEEFLAQK
ncbi:UDP-N-acetylmuramoyl-L-alanyl-D-glutamate--2,6-diaminopimelate ligase [bacterium 210820-DFI.6.37]|nr:UDP-N-acetylmuramoyl-L-alanyl-D-glutamate--2,6-diaminopimelate ligase [bacterium 210820-DFI.6.37]